MGLTRITSDGITDATIDTEDIGNLVITNAKVATTAAIAGTKISPDFGSQAVTTTGQITGNSVTVNGDITLNDNQPRINFTDNNGDPDYLIQEDAGHFLIHDATNGADKFKIQSDGHIDITPNTDFGAGIDVTGSSSFDGFITLSSTHNRIIFTDTNADPDYMVDSNGGHFLVYDATNNQDKIKIFSDGHIDIHGNVDFISGGIDVTGAITATGSVSTDEVNITTATAGSQKTLKLNNTNASAGTNEITFSSTTSGTNFEAASIRNGVPNHLNGSLQFKTANGSGLQTAMIIENNQRVGIGTTSPSQKLDVSGGIKATTDITLASTTAGQSIIVTKNGTQAVKLGHIGTGNEGLLVLKENGTDTVKFNGATGGTSYINAGNVGIKTTSPIGTLNVHDGTFVLSKPSTNSASRNWRFLPDNIAAGNLGLQVSTAAGGSTFQNVLEVDKTGTIFTAQNGTAFSWPSNPGHVWYADGEARSTTANGVHYRINRMNGDGHAVQFYRGQTNMVGFISITSSSTGYGSGSSDERTKKNIEVWNEDILSKFKALTPKIFNFNWEEDGTTKHKGYIAQNELDKFPEAYPKNNLSDSGDEFYTFVPTDMTVYLMKGLKEAAEKIETLEAKVAALETK